MEITLAEKACAEKGHPKVPQSLIDDVLTHKIGNIKSFFKCWEWLDLT